MAAADFTAWLNSQNPYQTQLVSQYAPNTYVAPTWSDAGNASVWDQMMRARNFGAPQVMTSQGSNPWSSGGFGGTGSVAGPSGTGTASSSGGATLLRTIKDVPGQAALDAALRSIGGLSNAPQQNVFTTVKDPTTQTATNAASAQQPQDFATQRQSLADFTTSFLQGTPRTENAATQGFGALSAVYDPASVPT